MNPFKKATKKQARGRFALVGPAGSGKTYTGLTIAAALGPKIAVLDTEHGSASKYADLFEFDVLELDDFHPHTYVRAIRAAEQAGYDVLVIDSLSHAWSGKGGVLEIKDQETRRSRSGNSFDVWRKVTPLHNELVEAIVAARLHVVATMRAKTEYVLEQDERGKMKPRKVGMAPVQRDGVEYEFDVVADLTTDLDMLVSKSRCPALSGKAISRPGPEVGEVYAQWLSEGQPQESGGAPATSPRRAHVPAAGEGRPAPSDATSGPAVAAGRPRGGGLTRSEGLGDSSEASPAPAGPDSPQPSWPDVHRPAPGQDTPAAPAGDVEDAEIVADTAPAPADGDAWQQLAELCDDLDITTAQARPALLRAGFDLRSNTWPDQVRQWDQARLNEARRALLARFGSEEAAS